MDGRDCLTCLHTGELCAEIPCAWVPFEKKGNCETCKNSMDHNDDGELCHVVTSCRESRINIHWEPVKEEQKRNCKTCRHSMHNNGTGKVCKKNGCLSPVNKNWEPIENKNIKTMYRFKTEQEFINEFGKRHFSWNDEGHMDYLFGTEVTKEFYESTLEDSKILKNVRFKKHGDGTGNPSWSINREHLTKDGFVDIEHKPIKVKFESRCVPKCFDDEIFSTTPLLWCVEEPEPKVKLNRSLLKKKIIKLNQDN